MEFIANFGYWCSKTLTTSVIGSNKYFQEMEDAELIFATVIFCRLESKTDINLELRDSKMKLDFFTWHY